MTQGVDVAREPRARRIGLKVDVDTLRGTREGVPRLLDVFDRHNVRATFLFSLGPDHTGRAIRRVFRKGFVDKVRRTSVVHHYGVRTLLYGTVLPGPDIGRRAASVLRRVRDAGHETGIHCWDHIRWQDGVVDADEQWTRREMQRAYDRYGDIFGEPPTTHGAAGWQMNVHALRLTQQLGFHYCSDGRGTHPHLPVWRAELIRCPQFPTTLPTFDELIGTDAITEDNVADAVLKRTLADATPMHVFTLHAELEGGRLCARFETLLQGWQAQGWTPGPVRALYDEIVPYALPRCEAALAPVPGRTGTLLMQGDEFLGDADEPRAGRRL
jgi:peptidoglycan/xylan/chitin deacetylase (PgdA/CDA1 family)